jgi:thiol-disulfide isomerase/thioredoxin|uniref:Thioredoxin domain-containing protein n=1 Tax=Globisporangium ultimum (strain ATCC 200006 / CBS 805.95 / DAOM BR144) TaxID=431595 RepID=K3X081_GLOUD
MAPSGVNPMRFMQLALATTTVFSVVYMWQFVAMSVQDPADASGLVVAVKSRLLGQTRYVVQGFEAGHKFVSDYDVQSQGPLYILFMSDADANGTYWCPDCAKAHKPVYDAFSRAPRGSNIVEIRVGPVEYWADDMNEFRQNQLFYIDYIPTLMRYNGGGNSSTMLSERYCLDEELLDFVFRVRNPSGEKPKNNQIVTFKDPESVVDYVDKFDNSYPLFISFVSGFHSFNGRLWCPYCDRADVAVMHYYNTTAPENAVLIRAVVAETYKKWKKKKNPFKRAEFREKIVHIRGVPYLGRITKDAATNKVHVQEFLPDFDAKEQLQLFYKQ